jgi:hypothetical protein
VGSSIQETAGLPILLASGRFSANRIGEAGGTVFYRVLEVCGGLPGDCEGHLFSIRWQEKAGAADPGPARVEGSALAVRLRGLALWLLPIEVTGSPEHTATAGAPAGRSRVQAVIWR